MGHADLKTTERYLHARSEAETAARFTNVFSPKSRGADSRLEDRLGLQRLVINGLAVGDDE
jgi:hypothetical protein